MSHELLEDLVRLGCFAADGKVIAAGATTGVERTRIAVEAALDALIEQGYIEVKPPATWPVYFEVRP